MKKTSEKNGEVKLEKISSEQLKDRKAEIEKLKGKHDYHNVASILKLLQKSQITRELLQETLIGKTMTALSQLQTPPEHGDKESEVKEVRELST
jgi:predicted lipoprotein